METETKKVLIVDDERDICYLFSEILRKRNIQSGFVNSISDAVKILREDTPSLLFLDNRLPDGSGLDFIPYIKRNYPGVKVVMITAHDGPLDKKIAYEKGADFFMGKPFNKELINTMIDRFS